MENLIQEIAVRTDRSTQFSKLIANKADILNVIELTSELLCDYGTLLYIISCSKEDVNLITDYGFQSFINNEKYQKYYEKR